MSLYQQRFKWVVQISVKDLYESVDTPLKAYYRFSFITSEHLLLFITYFKNLFLNVPENCVKHIRSMVNLYFFFIKLCDFFMIPYEVNIVKKILCISQMKIMGCIRLWIYFIYFFLTKTLLHSTTVINKIQEYTLHSNNKDKNLPADIICLCGLLQVLMGCWTDVPRSLIISTLPLN